MTNKKKTPWLFVDESHNLFAQEKFDNFGVYLSFVYISAVYVLTGFPLVVGLLLSC